MFAKAVNLIMTDLRAFIALSDPEGPDAPDYVISGNIAMADAPDLTPPINQRVVVSVVNIAEEAAFKNAAHYERIGAETRYRNAPVFLNLYVLFSANYENYDTALRRLSQVITFFQGKNTFTLKNSPVPEFSDDATELRLILELFALTFEQVNYLWASLGGKQMPFVLYKLRLVRIQADRTQATSPVIEEIVADKSAV
ncbi:MAG: hypothetical protein DHS20C01_31310 [marine bacterium B5-7]|nr:MAG: hypothetical protein DHS20C01_31310 [marine bacterium B5-7]